jgi:hypothetical protein
VNRVQIGYDPAGGADSLVFVEVQPRMHGFRRAILNGMVRANNLAAPRRPGKLGEYPSRVAHARAHRLRSEIRRRDRRRARTGRPPIRPATYPILPSHMWLRAMDQAADLAAAATATIRAFERAVVPMREAMQEFAESLRYAIPHRFMAGTAPEGTLFDDVAAYRRRVEGELTESGRARREQALAGPYITADELRRQMAEAEQQEAERADRYRRELARLRARDGDAEAALEMVRRHGPRPFASGGVIHERREPDDDIVPVRIAGFIPVERWMLDDFGNPVGEQNERDFRAVARTLGPPLGDLPDAATWRGDVMHHDRYLGEGNLDRDETSSVHSTDSSGTGAVWTDLMTRIDDLVDGED